MRVGGPNKKKTVGAEGMGRNLIWRGQTFDIGQRPKRKLQTMSVRKGRLVSSLLKFPRWRSILRFLLCRKRKGEKVGSLE